MIEFKQIIGRGTCLYDDKDYFTILEFVKTHHHFSDPEWDGDPIDPEGPQQRISRPKPAEADAVSGKDSSEGGTGAVELTRHPQQTAAGPGREGLRRREAGGEAGNHRGQASDLFDVLAYVAYALPPIPREDYALQARLYIHSRCTSKQQLFLDFVLQHYVSSGVQELAQEKLSLLLRLRYQNSIADAMADLGRPEEMASCLLAFRGICMRFLVDACCIPTVVSTSTESGLSLQGACLASQAWLAPDQHPELLLRLALAAALLAIRQPAALRFSAAMTPVSTSAGQGW